MRDVTLRKVSVARNGEQVTLQFDGGESIDFPRAAVRELRGLTLSDLKQLKPDNAGMTLSQRQRDIDIWLPGLLLDLLGVSPSALLGKKGGSTTSAAKRRAARENGRKGGRPKSGP